MYLVIMIGFRSETGKVIMRVIRHSEDDLSGSNVKYVDPGNVRQQNIRRQ